MKIQISAETIYCASATGKSIADSIEANLVANGMTEVEVERRSNSEFFLAIFRDIHNDLRSQYFRALENEPKKAATGKTRRWSEGMLIDDSGVVYEGQERIGVAYVRLDTKSEYKRKQLTGEYEGNVNATLFKPATEKEQMRVLLQMKGAL